MAKTRWTYADVERVQRRNGQSGVTVSTKVEKPEIEQGNHVYRGAEVIYGKVPSKSNGYKVGNGKFYKSKQVIVFEQEFLMQCTKYRDANISGKFAFYLDVYFKNPASDLDGSFKIILDMLQKVNAITNDKNCMAIYARKFIDKKTPRI